jgi:hypothetical protein
LFFCLPSHLRNLSFVLFLCPLIVCCAGTPPEIGRSYAIDSPSIHKENRVLFLKQAAGAKTPTRDLVHGFDLEENEDLEIQALKPLGVVVRGVRIPADLTSPRDIAVVLDVVTVGSESATPMVVAYQRQVSGGQMMNFQDLLVYFDPEWDGMTPPYFRVRVIETNVEKSSFSESLLEEAARLPGALGLLPPHPILPIVSTAIKAAGLILTNPSNKVLLDFQVQFYSKLQVDGSGGTTLNQLRKGAWLVVGRPGGQTSEFWESDLSIDLRSGLIRLKNEPGKAIQSPYVSVAIFSAEASVAKEFLDRSHALLQLLGNPVERSNLSGLEGSVEALSGSLALYSAQRRIQVFGSSEEFRRVVELLTSEASRKELPQDVQDSLLRLISKSVKTEEFTDFTSLSNWWKNIRAQGELKQENGEFHWNATPPKTPGGGTR